MRAPSPAEASWTKKEMRRRAPSRGLLMNSGCVEAIGNFLIISYVGKKSVANLPSK